MFFSTKLNILSTLEFLLHLGANFCFTGQDSPHLKKKNSKNPPLKKLVLISFTLSCPYTCKDSILDSNLRIRILRIFKLLPENYSAMSVSILYKFQQISMKESFKKLEKPYFEGLFWAILSKCSQIIRLLQLGHSMHWSINCPSETFPPFFSPSPLLIMQTVQGPLFREFPPIYWFFVNPPSSVLKIGFFSEPP